MARRLSILTTLLGLTCWVVSCQQALQTTIGVVSPSTSSPLGELSMTSSTAIASGATPINTPMLAVTASTPTLLATPDSSPLAITGMRAKAYPGSDIVIESTLSTGPDYNRYIVSY